MTTIIFTAITAITISNDMRISFAFAVLTVVAFWLDFAQLLGWEYNHCNFNFTYKEVENPDDYIDRINIDYSQNVRPLEPSEYLELCREMQWFSIASNCHVERQTFSRKFEKRQGQAFLKEPAL